MSVLLLAFIIVLINSLITLIGTDTIASYAWSAYSRFIPGPHSGKVAQYKKLQIQALKTKTEMQGTSSQDEFAKWAKLRRRFDKEVAEMEKITQDLSVFKAGFQAKFKTGIWAGTKGVRYFSSWWYGKQAVFYLPKGWFPYWVEYVLSFPKAPMGAVSSTIWFIAAERVIGEVLEVVAGQVKQYTAPKVTKENVEEPEKKVPVSAGREL
ncbi:putative retrograde vesicle-mediated transport protein Get1 [Saitoella complicata NRRL Y-17804]|nr:putative retrograde vesicle-mediated transport protein Get1 [Saitoella complicata NRRL Y-17804]ODQ52857.1 putative retrograde vesicle-mediated transport protein Get1 [Saitoella complicata NRRL Y-17804]